MIYYKKQLCTFREIYCCQKVWIEGMKRLYGIAIGNGTNKLPPI